MLPDDEKDNNFTLSRFRNGMCYVSSFNVNQREMLESVKRVTGTSWSIKYQPVKDRYVEGVEQLRDGNRIGLMKALYSRVFFDDNSGNYESKKGTHNKLFGLPEEDLDDFARVPAKRVEQSGTMY